LERENGKNSKAETSKDRDKRRERIALAVRDYRAGGAGTAQNAPLPLVETGPAAAREPELPADFRAPGGKPLGGGGDREAKPALGLRDPPALEFAENLNGDIVRHASVILRSGGSGTIRLALKPETLGNIKIRLEMTENKVMGHIILETKEALRAFERELQGLEQAFRDSGFDGADFEMALTSGGGENSGDAPGNGENFPFVAGRLAASTYDAALESAEEFPFWDIPAGEGRVFVNVLV
jgi:hypothetical protein